MMEYLLIQKTAMTLAARGGHENVVKLLVSRGVSPDIRATRTVYRFNMFSALYAAAERGHLSVFKYLVEVRCDLDFLDPSTNSILSRSAEGGHSALVRFMLQVKPDIESPPSRALYAAAEKGHLEVVDIILNHWAIHIPAEDIPMDSIIAATKARHQDVVMRLKQSIELEEVFLRRHIGENDSNSLFLLCAIWDWEHLTQRLLDRGFPGKLDRYTLRGDHLDVEFEKYDFWLASEPQHVDPSSCLGMAAREGHHGIVKLLLSRMADMEDDMNSETGRANALFLAIIGGHHEIVKTLLANGVDPNYRMGRDSCEQPVFFHAAGNPEILRTLLDSGADFTSKIQKSSETILIRVLRTGNVGALRVFKIWIPIEDPPNPVLTYLTSLFEAASIGGAAVMEYLLDEGYHVSPGSPVVKRALQYVLSRSDTESLRLLLDRGLVEPVSAFFGDGSIILIDSPGGDLVAVATTLDMLLAHGFEINALSKLVYDVILGDRRYFHFPKSIALLELPLLLERGADVLVGGLPESNLFTEFVFKHDKDILRMVLRSLEHREIPLEFLKRTLNYVETETDDKFKWGADGFFLYRNCGILATIGRRVRLPRFLKIADPTIDRKLARTFESFIALMS